MPHNSEVQKGIQVLTQILESGRVLRLRPPQPLRDRFAYIFTVTAYQKQWEFMLSAETLSDLPNMPEYLKAAQSYASALGKRMRNPVPNGFFCRSGDSILVEIEWPPERLPSRAASALVVRVENTKDSTVANGYVVITLSQREFSLKSNPFLLQSSCVNSVRAALDDGSLRFYRNKEHPLELQPVDLKLEYSSRVGNQEIDALLRGKVYWLAFRTGSSSSRVWISDPWDADYLQCSTKQLLQQAEILAAQEELVLDDSGEFATIGKGLLKKASAIEELPSNPQTTRTDERDYQWDVFISHATEDKEYVASLVRALEVAEVRVWFDRNALQWGDDLRPSIDRGLVACKFGVVVFSRSFLSKKKWTEYELNSLFARERGGRKVILPIWHGIDREDVVQYSPALADRLAKQSKVDSPSEIVNSVLVLLGRSASPGIEAVPALPDVTTLINTGPSQNKRLVRKIAGGADKLMAWEILREGLPDCYFVEFSIRGEEPKTCITTDYTVANRCWNEWYKHWSVRPAGFGGTHGDGLDGRPPW